MCNVLLFFPPQIRNQTQYSSVLVRLFACEILIQEFQMHNKCVVYTFLLLECREESLPLTASVASLRCNFLLYISSSAVWEACYSCRCHKKRGSLSFSLLPVSFTLSLSLLVFAALIPRQVLQWACSAGSPCLIVCYFFNTYIMYFIRICCQSLSVPLHPVTLIFFFLKEVGAFSTK